MKIKKHAGKEEIIDKIMEKKEFSLLPRKEIETAFSHFQKRQVLDTEKIRLSRELLHKIFGAFGSRKLLGIKGKALKEKDKEWFLRKHLSTQERLPFYKKIYERILKNLGKKITIIDMGAGVNGFSYVFFDEIGYDVNYTEIEAVGQFVDLTNNYFTGKKLNAKAIHLSLFQTEKIKKIVRETKKPKVIFMFKIVDALEAMERNYSKKLISEIAPLADRLALSFPTKSMVKRKGFEAKRTWLTDFLRQNFKIIDDFSFGGERYIVFSVIKR